MIVCIAEKPSVARDIARIIGATAYQAFFSLIAVAIIYFILEWILVSIVTRVQVSIDPKRRAKSKILEGIREVE